MFIVHIAHICILYKKLCTGSRFIVYNNVYTKYTKNSEQVHNSLCDLTNAKKTKELEKPGKTWEKLGVPGSPKIGKW